MKLWYRWKPGIIWQWGTWRSMPKNGRVSIQMPKYDAHPNRYFQVKRSKTRPDPQ